MKICIVTTPIRPVPCNFPPMGSMSIIQSLREVGQEVFFHHIDYHRYSKEDNYNYFKKNQFDVVGISSVVSTAYEYTKYLSKLIKEFNPNTIVLVGGSLVASAEILHRKSEVDFCVIGDGEIIIKNLVKAIEDNKLKDEDLAKIKGITFIDSQNKFKFTGYGKPIPAPLLETPDYSILEDDKSINHYISEEGYRTYELKNYTGGKRAIVIVAKGCVARCTFCHRLEKGYRVSPLEKIKKHIIMLKEKYGVSYLCIGDENFGSYKDETKELVSFLGEQGLSWVASGVRAHTADLEMLKFWKKNGCESVIFGIESGSPTMLEVMEKKITVEKNIEALKYVYEAKLATVTQFVIGMPGETDQTIEETIDFLLKTMKYYPDPFRKKITILASVNYAQSLPGTPLYEYAREHGFIGSTLDDEEKYLLKISDKNAYDSDHFINFTQQPLLKVLSWRHKITWKVWRKHAELNLKIKLSKPKIFLGLLAMFFNKFFKIKINSTLERELNKFQSGKERKSLLETHNDTYVFRNTAIISDGVRLLIPWNKITYPFLALLIAIKESKNLKLFFKMIIEHLIWSLKKFDTSKLPTTTLRKVVNILDKDETLEIRKGR